MEWTINNSQYMGLEEVNVYEGRVITLLTLDEFRLLPENTKLINIFGQVKLSQDCDDDTRHGYVAYGLLSEIK